jgi:hypothetical protein
MEKIYKYLNELFRCEWNPDLSQGITYNGISNIKGCDYYNRLLSQMNSESEILLCSLPQNQLIAIHTRIVEICEWQYDVITWESVESLKRDSKGENNRKDIELGEHVVAMFGVQDYYRHKLRRFIEDLLGFNNNTIEGKEEVTIKENNDFQDDTDTKLPNREVIKGVAGLAKYLGFGKTMAQAIIKSELLMTNGSQYRAGKSWFFNPEKIEDLLKENPNLLENVHIKRPK